MELTIKETLLQQFCGIADLMYQKGWDERNGGNISMLLRDEDLTDAAEPLEKRDYELGYQVPELAGRCFLVTGSGKYFKNVLAAPEENLGVIRILEDGEHYRILWGLAGGAKPTSELPTHLMNHEVKKRVSNGKHRVIYHAHTTNVIALTFVLPLKDEIFTRELWEMATECPVVFPDGVGVIGWMVPGGRKIALETGKLMEKYDAVIWAHHGMFCSGENFDLTFGLMHTIEKSAEILIKVLSMKPDKLQTITPDNFRDLAVAFHLQLPERFLYEKEE